MSIQRNSIYNLVGSVAPFAVSLITIPVYLRLIGEERYGVLAIAWLLLGYFSLFDLGLGRATAQRIAALKDRPLQERAQTFWTALTLNVVFGIIGGLLLWPIASFFFGSEFEIKEAVRSEMQNAVFWFILAVPIATLSGVLTGALQGLEKFLELNFISVLGTVLFQLLPLAVASWWKIDLGLLLPAAIFTRVITLIVLFERCWRHVLQGYKPTFDRTQAGFLLRFGGWVAVTSFVGPMMVVFDRFMIGAISGASSVAYYTIPFQLSERITLASNALTTALFPRFTTADVQEGKRLAREGLRSLLVITTPLAGIGIFFIEPFIMWWITPEFAKQSAQVGKIIILGFWVNGFARISYAQLQAMGRPDLVAKCHLLEVLPYIGMLYLSLKNWGLVGAAVIFSFRVVLDFFLLSSLARTLKSSLSEMVAPAILLILAFVISNQDDISSLLSFGMTVVNLLVLITWAWKKIPKDKWGLKLENFKFT